MIIQFEISDYLYKCLKKRIELHAASELDMLVDKGTVIEQEPKTDILEQIRAKLLEEYNYYENQEDIDTSFGIGIAIDVFDKAIKEQTT